MDHRLINLLVCPLCKGPLHMARNPQGQPEGLVCKADRLVFPVRDGIPVMLETEATPLPPETEPAPIDLTAPPAA
jgi:uncharacterized protein YbaR (Trm112 family)